MLRDTVYLVTNADTETDEDVELLYHVGDRIRLDCTTNKIHRPSFAFSADKPRAVMTGYRLIERIKGSLRSPHFMGAELRKENASKAKNAALIILHAVCLEAAQFIAAHPNFNERTDDEHVSQIVTGNRHAIASVADLFQRMRLAKPSELQRLLMQAETNEPAEALFFPEIGEGEVIILRFCFDLSKENIVLEDIAYLQSPS